VWQLRGRYPNRGYPKIFNDATVGSEARKLFEEAQTMLADFVANKRVRLNGIVGFYPANAVGDDIEVGAAHGKRSAALRCVMCAVCVWNVGRATVYAVPLVGVGLLYAASVHA
jgi:cobalamin-dependent methionine synthase I